MEIDVSMRAILHMAIALALAPLLAGVATRV